MFSYMSNIAFQQNDVTDNKVTDREERSNFSQKNFLGNRWNEKGAKGLVKTVVRNLEKNASYLGIKGFVGIAVNEWGCHNPIYTGLCRRLRGEVYPRSRNTGKFAYFAYIVFIAWHDVLYWILQWDSVPFWIWIERSKISRLGWKLRKNGA